MKKKGEGEWSNDIISPEHFGKLMELLKDIRYGSITLVIQDGKVIQIDKNEKVRLK